MGIADRAYSRDLTGGGMSSGGGPLGMKMWSATTWLIAICVAVFVIDGFFPAGWHLPVVSSFHWVPGYEGNVDLGEATRDYISDSLRRVIVNGHHVATETYADRPPIEALLHYSTDRFLNGQLWRLIGFQFLHANLYHILFNMIGLYFFGPMVERYLGSKRYLAFYLLCGIAGALMYTLLNIAGWVTNDVMGWQGFPGVLVTDSRTPLIGASAGVFGVILAGAYLAPNARVLVFFLIPMPLRLLAYGLVAMSLFTLITGGHNAGGEAGHLGGAIAGWYFIRHPRHLHDFFDVLGRADPTSHHYGHGGRPATATPGRQGPKSAGPSAAEIDRILGKVKREGLHSLTAKERKALHQASERGVA